MRLYELNHSSFHFGAIQRHLILTTVRSLSVWLIFVSAGCRFGAVPFLLFYHYHSLSVLRQFSWAKSKVLEFWTTRRSFRLIHLDYYAMAEGGLYIALGSNFLVVNRLLDSRYHLENYIQFHFDLGFCNCWFSDLKSLRNCFSC